MIDWVYINKHRCTKPERTVPPQFCSTEGDGFNGMFRFPIDGKTVRCMISDGGGWKHVLKKLGVQRATISTFELKMEIETKPVKCQ